ncbi:hypothetical protein [Eubacterium sp.]|uniref:hypothetical protein n=1 Tax=Eubacterium sp. TaxID=142586 RepID=UPI0025E27163|nr:hypothetical protein [Eubacterium sp.]MCR5629276.1 hypothetical protein [Eubacterium sp.]
MKTLKKAGIGLSFFIIGTIFVLLFIAVKMVVPEYLKEVHNRKKYTEVVSALVEDVELKGKGKKVAGYQLVSYEYNGKKYKSEVEDYVDIYYYTEEHIDSTMSYMEIQEVKSENERELKKMEEKQQEHFKELEKTIGKTEEIFINPKNPSKAVKLADDATMTALKIFAFTAVGIFVGYTITLVILIIIFRKKLIYLFNYLMDDIPD